MKAMLDVRCWMLDRTKKKMILDIRCWILDRQTAKIKYLISVFLAFANIQHLTSNIYVFAAGSSAAQFLTTPIGARNVALGETGATASDVNATYWNPAALAFLRAPQIGLHYHSALEQVTYQYAAIAVPFSRRLGSMGANFTRVGVPDITSYDTQGKPIGTIAASDMAFSLSYGRKFYQGDRTQGSLGLALKMVQSKLHIYNATAQALDFGFMSESKNLFKKDSLFKAGFSISNFGGKMKFIESEAALPVNVRLGVSQEQKLAKRPLALLADVNLTPDGGRTLGLGAEYILGNIFALRSGIKSGEKGIGPATKFSLGFGLEVTQFQLAYSMTAAGRFGMLHRMDVIFSFPTRSYELTDAQKERIEKWYEQGFRLFNSARYAEAILVLDKILKKYPAHRDAFDLMQAAYEKIK